jgi:hypothetical protein
MSNEQSKSNTPKQPQQIPQKQPRIKDTTTSTPMSKANIKQVRMVCNAEGDKPKTKQLNENKE